MALPVVLLMGPTASGKTGLALDLAESLGAEIVSVDSAQVYRGMDIGSAKPDAEQRARVPHHLLDILDPSESYSAARFRADALRLIGEIRGRGRIPLLAGGTMLYFHGLLRGISELPGADPAWRSTWSAEAEKHGWPFLHARLAKLDPDSAARLHPNDGQRILRALEIVERTGKPVAEAQAGRVAGGFDEPSVALALWIEERKVLHQRIAQRFEAMMAGGFLDEVRRLRSRGDLDPDLPSMRAVGYRQLWAHLDGEWDLPTAVDRGVAATRQLAKRQCTWLRSMTGIERLDPLAADVFSRARTLIERAKRGAS